MELRALIIAFAVGMVVFTGMSIMTFGFIGDNGQATPQGQYVATIFKNSTLIQSSTTNLSNETTLAKKNFNLTAPGSITQFLGNFQVFGGIISGALGYMTVLPNILSNLVSISSSPIAGTSQDNTGLVIMQVVIILGGIAGLVLGVIVIFEFYSSITKYRV